MQRTTEQDERMARYLLGDLPEAEAEAVEQEYFADPEKLESVWAAENDLVDRYVRGRLARAERELFERNYLRSQKHRERVVVARSLLNAADREVVEDESVRQAARPASYRRNKWVERWFGPRLQWVGLAAATLLIF